MSKLKKLGNLSLAILEHKIKGVIGEPAIEILKNKHVEQENLIEAIANTEERFRRDYPDAQVTKALFDDLSLENLPSLDDAFEAFYKRPTEGSLHATLTTFIQDDLKTLSEEKISEIIEYYLIFFRQELLQVDEKFREIIRGLSDLERLEYSKQTSISIAELVKILTPTSQTNQEDQFKITISRLPSTGAAMFGRKEEVEMLETAWNENQTNVLALVAWGGVGKSALVNHWLGKLGQDNYNGARKVYAWSFYSQGTGEERQSSADLFIAHALKWFGDPEPETGSAWEKAERLAELVRKDRTLMILDGLEPLQHKSGEIKDPALAALLRELAGHNPGLCLVTTRIEINDLEGYPKPNVIQRSLEHLKLEAGADYLAALGIDGTKEERQLASEEYGGHALALTLLGNYLKIVHRGDLRKRDLIPDIFADPKEGGHARRVMASYEEFFKDDPAIQILYMLGLFDRPIELAARQALLAGDPIPGLTEKLAQLSTVDWAFALDRLREAGLLTKKNQDEWLDTHPLVREHFAGHLHETNPEAWREAHGRLYAFYQTVPEKDQPDTLDELEPLYRAVYHGCMAGQHQKALVEVYNPRIRRGDKDYSTQKLGAYGADLAGLANFFESLWSNPSTNLTEIAQSLVLSIAGFNLRALGRLEEAVGPNISSMKGAVDGENWGNAAIAASNLSMLHNALGNLATAAEKVEQGVYYADNSGIAFLRMACRANYAAAQHQLGKQSVAQSLFEESERIQSERQPYLPWLYSMQGFLYCKFLLDMGEIAAVRERVNYTLEIDEKLGGLFVIGLDHLILGRVGLLAYLASGTDTDLAKAESELNTAVNGLRHAGVMDDLASGLLGRAALWRVKEEGGKAEKDLAEAEQIARRSGMRLHICDWHLESARLALAREDKEGAKVHYHEAKKMVEEMSYHRRDGELKLLAESLGQEL